jgi:hypothetical protein
MPFRNNQAKRSVLTVEVREDIKQVWTIAAVAAAGWDPADLWREQLYDQDTGPILVEAVTRHRPEWKDITDYIPMYKSYWAQGKIPRCEESHTRAPLEIRQQTIKNGPDNSPSEQSERRADRTTW